MWKIFLIFAAIVAVLSYIRACQYKNTKMPDMPEDWSYREDVDR